MSAGDVDRAYADFCDAWIAGDAPDAEDFCRGRADCGPELRERIEAFLAVETCLERESARRPGRSPGTSAPAETEQGRELGGFTIVREIGRGGMGVVYEARQIDLDRTVALKVLPAHLTLREESVLRFRREASTAARLRHPAIVEIHAVGEDQGTHFFAMELVEGAPLDEVLDWLRSGRAGERDEATPSAAVYTMLRDRLTNGDRPELQAHSAGDRPEAPHWSRSYVEIVCRFAARIADALEFAHSEGVIHRDVKPSNIIVRDDASVVLTDFGLAREEGLPSLTVTGDFAGTPHYISPEQASQRGIVVDHRTDVYSLGVTLYELLTLERPFDGKTSQEILGKIVSREPSMVRTRNPQIPRDLETICMTAMEKEPDRRYASAGELRDDLLRFLDFKPVKARPVSAGMRLYRFIRRNPLPAAVALLLFVVVVVGPFLFGIQEHLAHLEIARALEEKKRALRFAVKESRTATQVAQFMVKIFEISDPGESLGAKLTAREVLEQAAVFVNTRLAEEPEFQAQLKGTLGEVYISLGLYAEARPLLEETVAYYRTRPGESDIPIAVALHHLANLDRLQDLFEVAEPRFDEALAIAFAVCGKKDHRTLAIQNDLGSLYADQGRLEEAEALYARTLEAQSELLGEEHPDSLDSRNDLACLYAAQGRLDEAESLLRIVLKDGFHSIDVRHPDTLVTLQNVAVLFQKKGDLARAESLYVRTLERQREVVGDDHPHTLSTMGNLATLHAGAGRIDEALTLLETVLEGRRRRLGEDHKNTLSSMHNLASVYVALDRHAEAEELYDGSLEALRRVRGDEHQLTLATMNNLADFYVKTGRLEEAEALFVEALAGRRKVLGDDHVDTLTTLCNLAVVHARAERWAAALPLVREAVERTPPESPHSSMRQGLLRFIEGKVESDRAK